MKKQLCIIMVLVMLAISLGACGGSSNTTPAAPETTASESTAPSTSESTAPSAPEKPYAGQEINFLYFSGNIWHETVVGKLNEFEDKTGIKVNVETIPFDQISNKVVAVSQARSGELDVLAFSPPASTRLYGKNGYMHPLNDYIAADKEFDFEEYPQALRDAVTYEGKIQSIPLNPGSAIFWYNKKMFAEKGVKVPTTMEELEAAAAALHDPDKGIAGIAMRGEGFAAVTQVSPFLYCWGADFTKGSKATINEPEALEAIEFYAKLARNYGPKGVSSMKLEETTALFQQGLAAMRLDDYTQYIHFIDPSKSKVSDDVGYFAIPAGPKGRASYVIPSWSIGIHADSKYKDASWAFISWALGKEMDKYATLKGSTTCRPSTLADKESMASFPAELTEVINQSASFPLTQGHDRPNMIASNEARTLVGTLITAAIEGKTGAELKAVADNVNAQVQALLDEENK